MYEEGHNWFEFRAWGRKSAWMYVGGRGSG